MRKVSMVVVVALAAASGLTLGAGACIAQTGSAPTGNASQATPGSVPGGTIVFRDLTLTDGIAKAMPRGAKVAGGGLTIANTGAQDDRLLAVESPAAGRVELHEMTMDNDVMRMRKLDGIDVPAGGTVALSGHMHLMFLDIPAPFKTGDSIPLTLTFEKAGSVSYQLDVRSGPGN